MKQLVEVIAKALVDNPDEVVVTETQKDKAIVVNLKVASSDIGKVIGKSGRIAKSIRAVVSAAASKTDKGHCRDRQLMHCYESLYFLSIVAHFY